MSHAVAHVAMELEQVSGSPGEAKPGNWTVGRVRSLPNQDCSVIGGPRIFLDTRLVYCVISERGRGLSLGVNLCPDKHCNFHCVYCEVDRNESEPALRTEPEVIAGELQRLLALIGQNKLREIPEFQHAPDELLRLKEAVLCGDGEPTLCPNFSAVVRHVVHVRAQALHPFFKLVLITNGTGLHLPEVQRGLEWFNSRDEVWIKLDAGTQDYMNRVNRSKVPLPRVLDNILLLARRRPVVIQSLFPVIQGEAPPEGEIEQYLRRLEELRQQGANILSVQIYSAHRSPRHAGCGHLPLKDLSRIARRVRESTGLNAEVF